LRETIQKGQSGKPFTPVDIQGLTVPEVAVIENNQAARPAPSGRAAFFPRILKTYVASNRSRASVSVARISCFGFVSQGMKRQETFYE